MKNILSSLIFTCIAFVSFSQDSLKVLTYKPVAKSFTAEVNFNPFSSSPISINYLRFRTFVTERQAFRMGFSIGLRNQKAIENVTQS